MGECLSCIAGTKCIITPCEEAEDFECGTWGFTDARGTQVPTACPPGMYSEDEAGVTESALALRVTTQGSREI